MPDRIKLFAEFPQVTTVEWMEKIKADLKGDGFSSKLVWKSSMGFDVMPFYRREDIKGLRYMDTRPGEKPYIRGKKNLNNNWRIRQDITVSDFREANKKASGLIDSGIDSVGFYFTRPESENGNNFKILLENIDPEKTELSFLSDGRAKELITAFMENTAKYSYEKISGAVETDPLGRSMLNATLCIPPEKGFDYLAELTGMLSSLPHFRAVHINASATLADGLEYLCAGINEGLDIDAFAPRISFFWAIGMDHFLEIAKMRAARMLWARIVRSFNPKNPKSMALRTHCQTSGWSLTEQDPYNNVGRTCIEAMAAVFGHTQSLHTNALDEALALPTDFSAAIARDTHKYIREETDICRAIDPWGGSYYVESLTDRIAQRAGELITEVEKLGGMAKAIESGIPKMRIEEAAARTQAAIDSGLQVIVETNKYRLEKESPLETLEVDNTAVREAQIKRLAEVRASRNEDECRAALDAIGYKSDKDFNDAKALVKRFAEKEGRQPRIMIAKMGQDGHDRGARVVATGYADIGFDVDIGLLFQTPAEAAKQAVENDVHVLGVSSLAAGHKTLVPMVISELIKLGREDILVVTGGVIPPQDYQFLYDAGVAAIFGPGTSVARAAKQITEILLNSF